MKKVVCIGNSLAGIKAIEQIRQHHPEAEVTLFTVEGEPPYYRHQLGDLLARVISPEQIYYRPLPYYQDQRIHLSEQKISRINLRKNKITTEDKQIFEFDCLLLAGMDAPHFAEIKGVHKSGVYYSRRLADVRQLINNLLIIETVVIDSDDLSGLRLAVALLKRGKEVILVTCAQHVFPQVLDEESSQVVRFLLQEAGLRIITENPVSEILGESDVKAIRLKSGKVFAAQAVILSVSQVDLRLFKDTELHFDQQIPVNANLQTNIENIFALDKAAQGTGDGWEEDCDTYPILLEQQGIKVASHIQGEEFLIQPPLPQARIMLNERALYIMGKTQPQRTVQVLSHWDQDNKDYKKIFIVDHRAVGAVLFCDAAQKERIEKLIVDRTDISGQEESLFGSPIFSLPK